MLEWSALGEHIQGAAHPVQGELRRAGCGLHAHRGTFTSCTLRCPTWTIEQLPLSEFQTQLLFIQISLPHLELAMVYHACVGKGWC